MNQDNHPIRQHLWVPAKKAGEYDLHSRGGTVDMLGAVYIGPDPEGNAWFWAGPGDVRYMTRQQLADFGMILGPNYPGK
ncbi:hypothetical protein [Sphingomonas phage Kimi]|nr:hypothetical protein [Sphingomonas phage Kimi]